MCASACPAPHKLQQMHSAYSPAVPYALCGMLCRSCGRHTLVMQLGWCCSNSATTPPTATHAGSSRARQHHVCSVLNAEQDKCTCAFRRATHRSGKQQPHGRAYRVHAEQYGTNADPHLPTLSSSKHQCTTCDVPFPSLVLAHHVYRHKGCGAGQCHGPLEGQHPMARYWWC